MLMVVFPQGTFIPTYRVVGGSKIWGTVSNVWWALSLLLVKIELTDWSGIEMPIPLQEMILGGLEKEEFSAYSLGFGSENRGIKIPSIGIVSNP